MDADLTGARGGVPGQAEGGGAEVALQVQGGAVAVSGELRVFSQASLQLAGDLGGPGVVRPGSAREVL